MTKPVIVITGAGGFIGGALVRYLRERTPSSIDIRAVDKKPLRQWHQRVSGVEERCLDVSIPGNCRRVCEDAIQVYNLAADMGGMGFIERHRIACMRSVLINTHMIEAAYKAGVERYFFSSSACVYNTELQQTADIAGLKETDAYPAMAERGYGWEKLFSEMVCQEYWAERKMPTFIARFHNVYGPYGTWDGGREKAPAAICRKVIEAAHQGTGKIGIWGDGTRTRSYMYIDDCVQGIDRIMHHNNLIATPINLGSEVAVSVNELVEMAEMIGGVLLEREYDMSAPQGVTGRNSDNTLLRKELCWEPNTTLRHGLGITYDWIKHQYLKRQEK